MVEIKFKNTTQEVYCYDVLVVKNAKETLEYWYVLLDEYNNYATEIKTGGVLVTISDADTISFLDSLEEYFINCEFLYTTEYKKLLINISAKEE
jgi:hypothetical protein